MIIKPIAEETTLTDEASTVDGGRVIRIYNDAGSDVLVTRRDSSNNVLGTCTLANGSIQFVEKFHDETLEASANVKAVSVAYTIS